VHPKIDVSGNNVYIVWDKTLAANDAQNTSTRYDHVFLAKSRDGGDSFTKAINISTDNLTGPGNYWLYPSVEAYNNSTYVIWTNGSEDNVADVLLTKITSPK
jgi:hypothetical protein